jgi:hypothetical protein
MPSFISYESSRILTTNFDENVLQLKQILPRWREDMPTRTKDVRFFLRIRITKDSSKAPTKPCIPKNQVPHQV